MNSNSRKSTAFVIDTILMDKLMSRVETSWNPTHEEWMSFRDDWMTTEVPSRETLRFVFFTLHKLEGLMCGAFGDLLDSCHENFITEFLPEDLD
jgi:hypothetical protein